MKDTTIDFKLSVLKVGLLNLSKNYKEQIKLYPEFVDVFDEVLSDFEDGFILLPSLIYEGIVKEKTASIIKICDNLININLKNDDLLSDESFEFSNSWNEVRMYAKKAFDSLLDDIHQ
ncbi:hypothetical protein [Myroides odoratus]|uniref:hypothetical protein n=1 Tax=Myroides odoratus TaxID=256 RepID=UPI0033426031